MTDITNSTKKITDTALTILVKREGGEVFFSSQEIEELYGWALKIVKGPGTGFTLKAFQVKKELIQ